VPFSIYLGWITVATVANVTAWLEWIGWGGFGISEQGWAAIMLAVAVVVGALMAVTRGDIAYLLVLAWAFVGIAVKHGDDPTVATAAWVATGAVVAPIVYSLFRRPRPRAPRPAV
jgi:di/tricarboxylate transporter